ncbi:MAG: alpha/beta hydrolase [Capsulimonas sp.]|uniref:RBBP9/YdeN family alpha/beta hydrolase n=1 Tax=Capsulimonas sp. TaxID=2494211 RepID=UPI0032672972
MSDVFLVLHGWGGNKPEHWQEHLVLKLKNEGVDVRYPTFPDPKNPNLAAWMTSLHSVLDKIPSDANLTVLAHSLGAILWMHHAGMSETPAHGPQAARVLLVAPPYVIREIPPLDAPPGAADFFPPPMSKTGIAAIGRETVIVASDTDDYSTFDQSSAYAGGLDVPIEKLAGGGHISPYYGYGEWPWVFEWALGRAALSPKPNK